MGRGGRRRGGGDFGSGSGSKFNCAARVGSDNLGYGPGSGFSFEPVQTSSVYLSIYLSIYVYMCVYIYIYIYIYSELIMFWLIMNITLCVI